MKLVLEWPALLCEYEIPYKKLNTKNLATIHCSGTQPSTILWEWESEHNFDIAMAVKKQVYSSNDSDKVTHDCYTCRSE